jgi:uncharacterized membrane protein YkvI
VPSSITSANGAPGKRRPGAAALATGRARRLTVVTAPSWFKRFLLPGLVFQSVVIGGGYGTGRELVEFFLRYGPTGGLLAMVGISMVVWSAVAAVSFAFAHAFATYDYRRFIKRLLGRAWVLYEACYLVYLLIVLAVIAAAAGQILLELFGLPYLVGVVAITAAVGLVVVGGTKSVERFLATWSFVLYGLYVVLVVLAFARFGDAIVEAVTAGEMREGWALAGVRYAGYNLGIIPAILFVARHAESRRDGLVAGLLAGPIAILPAVFLYLAMAGQYPAIVEQPVPANHLLELLGSRAFQLGFQLVLFGTLVETGAGLIHAVNERLAGAFEERATGMPRALRATAAVTLLAAGAAMSGFGLIDLIARGYGTVTWGFLVLFVFPVLTVGAWRVFRTRDPGAFS